MIYVDTRRALWSPGHSFGRFYGTVALLGAAASAVVFGAFGFTAAMNAALDTAILAHAAVLAGGFLRSESTRLSTLTQRQFLPWLMPARSALFAVAALASLAATAAWPWAIAALLASFVAQLLERYAFFTTVRAPKMPGGI
jgi:DMSO reductase anchor subunit